MIALRRKTETTYVGEGGGSIVLPLQTAFPCGSLLLTHITSKGVWPAFTGRLWRPWTWRVGWRWKTTYHCEREPNG